VAHRKAVQRIATASRGTIVLNRLQPIGLPFTNSIPKLRKFNFYASDKARSQRLINPELDDDKDPVRLVDFRWLMTIIIVMKERMVPAGEFKAKCLQILDEVNRSKEPVTVTKRGKPVARIISIPQRKSAFGSMAGTVLVEDDIVGPIDEPWDAEAET
jgi:prevent-host-death family protein